MKSPNHIAIIMDGNGRWGIKHYKDRAKGHEFGIKNIKKILEYCVNSNIKNITLYALSFDNFQKRKKIEINNLFYHFKKYLNENISFFIKKKIKLNFIGELNLLPKDLIKIINENQAKTDFKKNFFLLNIAINYSSRRELLSVFSSLKKNRNIKIYDIDKLLYTRASKYPDILIRTGGYCRMSDFLLWQCAYTEFFFLKKLWPDFNTTDLKKIFFKYSRIKRNYGS